MTTDLRYFYLGSDIIYYLFSDLYLRYSASMLTSILHTYPQPMTTVSAPILTSILTIQFSSSYFTLYLLVPFCFCRLFVRFPFLCCTLRYLTLPTACVAYLPPLPLRPVVLWVVSLCVCVLVAAAVCSGSSHFACACRTTNSL